MFTERAWHFLSVHGLYSLRHVFSIFLTPFIPCRKSSQHILEVLGWPCNIFTLLLLGLEPNLLTSYYILYLYVQRVLRRPQENRYSSVLHRPHHIPSFFLAIFSGCIYPQGFCLFSFTDMIEMFWRQIQNSHDQTVLTILISALYNCPEPRSCCLKLPSKSFLQI